MKPTLHRLKNNLPVILVPQAGATSLTVLVLVQVGSRYETLALNGASHFIEHLMFKGTKRRPTSEALSRELDRFGAEYNAYTDKDVTGYYVKIEAGQAKLAVDILHDMLFHSLYDAKEMDRERGVIVEEINMYEDNPRMHIDDLLETVQFPGSTLGWNIAGPREVIRTVSRDALIGYRDAYYLPERMTIAIAGAIPKGIMPLLEHTFGSVKRPSGNDKPFVPFTPPKKLDQAFAFQDKATEQVQLMLSFYGLKIGHPDVPAAQLLASILGGSMSSRLFVEIREKRGLCYSVSASHGAREDCGQFTIGAGLEKTRVKEAVKAIVHELKDVTKNGVTAEELARAKQNARGKTMLAFEDSSTQAEWYGRQWLFQGKMETPDERMRRYDRVTKADLKRVAKLVFNPGQMASAMIGPFGSKTNAAKLITWS